MNQPTDRPTIVDTAAMDWISGPDLLKTMDPAFVANLGARAEVDDAYSHYLVKPLLREESGRRMDLAQFTPGYRDVTACYHRSAEEGFCLDGSFDLAYEGRFETEHYFWRPPGWVHGTVKVDEGATAIFSFEADSDTEQSGPVTRSVVDYAEVGTNPLLDDDEPSRIGPRGYMPNVAGALVARTPGAIWIPDSATATAFDAARLTARTLSRHHTTGGGTFLVDLAPGYAQPGPIAITGTYHFFVTSGSVSIDGTEHGEGAWVYVPARVELGAVSSQGGATLYLKSDETFTLA